MTSRGGAKSSIFGGLYVDQSSISSEITYLLLAYLSQIIEMKRLSGVSFRCNWDSGVTQVNYDSGNEHGCFPKMKKQTR